MSEVSTVGALPPVPVFLHEGHATTTSHDVAEFFGKRHDDVLKRIRTLECSADFNARNFAEIEYFDARNRPQRMYRMSRDGFTFLAMGFTGARAAQFKEGFIAAFNAMEDQLRGGAALPALAQAVMAVQQQVAVLVANQSATDHKVNAILDLVDVTKRYVGLLEANQKKPPRTAPYALVTVDLEAQLHDLVAQGFSITDISRRLNIPRVTVHKIAKGEYSPSLMAKNSLKAQALSTEAAGAGA